MSWTPHAHQAVALPPALPIPEDEAPTAFYRRPRRQTSGAPERARETAPAPPPEQPSKPRRTRRQAKSAPTPSPSPPTLLLPTSEARDQTSDGTILSPLAQPTDLPGNAERRWRDLNDAWRRLVSTLSRVAASARTGRTSGLGLITSATALAFVGVLAVAYAYLSTDDPLGAEATASRSQEQGLVDHAVDLGRRLRRPTTIPERRP